MDGEYVFQHKQFGLATFSVGAANTKLQKIYHESMEVVIKFVSKWITPKAAG